MSAANIVLAGVKAALPADYDDAIFAGWMLNDTPDGRAVAVYPVGGQAEDWGTFNVPRMVRDRVRVRLRALASDPDGWLNAMGDRLRYAVLATGHYPITTGRLYFSRSTFFDVSFRWVVVRIQTASPPRLSPGRKYAFLETDFRVIMRPLPELPLRVPLAWAGSPFTVFEQASDTEGVEVARNAVQPGRVLIGGQITSGPAGPLNNPADDAFREAAQGAFAEAGPGEVLWRNTGVGVDGSNLFDQTTTNEIPEAEGGGLVTLLRIEAGAGDVISFVTRQEFGKDLSDNGLFIGRLDGTVHLFRLQGAPRNVGGDFYYDTTSAGLTTAAATAAAEWDWAFADGSTWRAEPWVSEPPAGARWSVSVKIEDGQGSPLASYDDLQFPAGEEVMLPVEQFGNHGGEVVQRLLIRSVTPITSRSRYTVRVTVDGLIVHGEPGAPVAAPDPREHGPGWSEAYA